MADVYPDLVTHSADDQVESVTGSGVGALEAFHWGDPRQAVEGGDQALRRPIGDQPREFVLGAEAVDDKSGMAPNTGGLQCARLRQVTNGEAGSNGDWDPTVLRAKLEFRQRRFALANNGITIRETAATVVPGRLRSGVLWPISVEVDS